MKKFYLMLMFFVLILSGCLSAEQVKGENEVCEDITNSEDFMAYYPMMTIYSTEIQKRQTDVDNRTDIVYITTNMHNEDGSIEGSIDWIVTYGLYNEGWELESLEINYGDDNSGCYFYPVTGFARTDFDIYKELYIMTGCVCEDLNIYDYQFDPESMYTKYSFTGTLAYDYVVEEIDANFEYYFNTTTAEWYVPNYTINESVSNWRVSNIYRYTNQAGREQTVVLDTTFDGIYPENSTAGIDLLMETDQYYIYDADDFSLGQLFSVYPNSSQLTRALTNGYELEIVKNGVYASFDYVLLGKSNWPDIVFVGKRNVFLFEYGNYLVNDYDRCVEITFTSLSPDVLYMLPWDPALADL